MLGESAHWYVYLVGKGCQLSRQVCMCVCVCVCVCVYKTGRALPA